MKIIVSFLSIFALFALTVAPYAQGGEVKKQPLKMDEAVELYQEQAQDFKEVKDTEAGMQNGYGLLGLGLAVLVGYIVADQIDDNDDD